MSNFEDFGGKVTFEKRQNGEPAHLTIDYADVTRDEFKQLAQMRHCNEQDSNLPCCDIDFGHGIDRPAKLLHALERRGFDVDVDKENRTIEISKDHGLGSKYEEGREHYLKNVSDKECGPNIKIIHADFDHPHPIRHELRERRLWKAIKDE